MRIDMAIDTQENFYSFDARWNIWEKEASTLVSNTSEHYAYKIVSTQNNQDGYYIEPNHGQFSDESRGDNATLFVTKFNIQEGDQDLLTLGSCCNLKEDGVERYIENNESIRGENIVLWYVPRIRNDAREGHEYCWADTRLGEDGNLHVKVWPCIVGPKFIPIPKR
jgi:Cu2+-containing amine oxidase